MDGEKPPLSQVEELKKARFVKVWHRHGMLKRVDTLASMHPWLAKAWQAIEPFKLKQLGNMAVEAIADMTVRTWSHGVVKELESPPRKMVLLVEKPLHKCPQNVYLTHDFYFDWTLQKLQRCTRSTYLIGKLYVFTYRPCEKIENAFSHHLT